MRERADSIGAALTIQTQPGQGTHINLVWSSEVAREVL
jgi:signal transduction histidine kinase